MALKVDNIDYRSFTGFEIKNDKGDVLFYTKGVDGIGGSSVCSQIFQFSDTDSNYITSLKSKGSETITLSNNYIEYQFLGSNLRRIGTDLYWDNDTSDEYFNPQCDINTSFKRFKEINFNYVNPNGEIINSNLYKVEISKNITTKDLKKN